MALAQVSLDDRYALERGRVLMTGIQALVRLPMLQRQRDRAAGLNTAGFISGYRGSPLGGLDQALWRARKFLEQAATSSSSPGINEDLAATAVWGSQQVGLFPGAKHDGVFALWYGKGPGVDRSLDVLKHGNHAGTSQAWRRAGGGRRRPCRQVLDPAAPVRPRLRRRGDPGAQPVGRAGLSRPRHPWLGDVALFRLLGRVQGGDRHGREHGRGRRRPAPGRGRAARRFRHAAGRPVDPLAGSAAGPGSADAAAQGLRRARLCPRQPAQPDRHRQPAAAARHHHRRQVLSRRAPGAGRSRHRRAARGRDRPAGHEGRHDLAARARGHPPLRRGARGDPGRRGEAPASRVPAQGGALQLERGRPPARDRQVRREGRVVAAAGRLAAARGLRADAGHDRPRDRRPDRPLPHQRDDRAAAAPSSPTRRRPSPASASRSQRVPHYCSGCPHNTSTRVPEGSRALAGIGCHYMATWIYPTTTQTFSQMGGEGVAWIGQAPFTETPHVFANLGDGTYFHSGILAIRAAVAAGVNITYKILYNDAVAMTGGQPLEGSLTRRPARAASSRPRAWSGSRSSPTRPRPRKHRRPARRRAGPAARRAGRGPAQPARDQGHHGPDLRPDLRRREAPPPQARQPPRPGAPRRHQRHGLRGLRRLLEQVELRLGRCRSRPSGARKREIDQSNCNKDYSCLNGFCPSFVTVEGGKLRKGKALAGAADLPPLPAPDLPGLGRALGHPDHRRRRHRRGHHRRHPVHGGASRGQGRHRARHGGPRAERRRGLVACAHRRRPRPALGAAHRRRRGRRGDRLRHRRDRRRRVPGQDAAGPHPGGGQQRRRRSPASSCAPCRAGAHRRPPPLSATPSSRPRPWRTRSSTRSAPDAAWFLDASHLATALMGDAIATNMFMLGCAWQRGLVPLGEEAIVRGDRAQRRRGRPEPGGLPVGPPRRARSGGRRARSRRRARRVPDNRRLSARPRRGDRAPRRLSDRLPERRLCRALPRAGRAGAQGRGGAGARAARR